MKKILSTVFVLFLLVGCKTNTSTNNDEKYFNLLDTLINRTSFVTESSFYTISTDISKTSEGYRYYVTFDNPKNAMYDVTIIAVEEGVDYNVNMAPNVGIFEEKNFNLVPFQANPDKGYVSGLTISGVSSSEGVWLRCLVQWHSKKQEVHQEFIEFGIGAGDSYD